MAMKSKINKELPSSKPMKRNIPNAFLNIHYPSQSAFIIELQQMTVQGLREEMEKRFALPANFRHKHKFHPGLLSPTSQKALSGNRLL